MVINALRGGDTHTHTLRPQKFEAIQYYNISSQDILVYFTGTHRLICSIGKAQPPVLLLHEMLRDGRHVCYAMSTVRLGSYIVIIRFSLILNQLHSYADNDLY